MTGWCDVSQPEVDGHPHLKVDDYSLITAPALFPLYHSEFPILSISFIKERHAFFFSFFFFNPLVVGCNAVECRNATGLWYKAFLALRFIFSGFSLLGADHFFWCVFSALWFMNMACSSLDAC